MLKHDPCGLICLCFTYLAVAYADYAVVRWILIEMIGNSIWTSIHAVSFNSLIFLLLFAHWRAVFTDPGTVPFPARKLDFSDLHSGNRASSEQKEGWTVCLKCEIYRPPRAHHCRTCNRCIRKMDHHCPWINNCVGERNQKYFLQFLIYVGAVAFYAAGLVVYAWFGECRDCFIESISFQHRVVHSIILMIESGLFGLFVVAIVIDQVTAIFSDTTAVEQVKGDNSGRTRRPKMSHLADVCGKGHPILWLFPCVSVPEPLSYNNGTYEV
ncbi:palmitoyltransferase ZDHHC3-like isoform X1 [Artemia franciscana]